MRSACATTAVERSMCRNLHHLRSRINSIPLIQQCIINTRYLVVLTWWCFFSTHDDDRYGLLSTASQGRAYENAQPTPHTRMVYTTAVGENVIFRYLALKVVLPPHDTHLNGLRLRTSFFYEYPPTVGPVSMNLCIT